MREALGPDIDLMCDINQRWDVRQAISIGRRIEQYHLFWLEDVVAHDDYPGMARVANALDTPVAGGEYVYGTVPFLVLFQVGFLYTGLLSIVQQYDAGGSEGVAAELQPGRQSS